MRPLNWSCCCVKITFVCTCCASLYNYKINITRVMQGIAATYFAFGRLFNKEFVEILNLNATVKAL